eukprot:2115889-Rhodomonas_salina.1
MGAAGKGARGSTAWAARASQQPRGREGKGGREGRREGREERQRESEELKEGIEEENRGGVGGGDVKRGRGAFWVTETVYKASEEKGKEAEKEKEKEKYGGQSKQRGSGFGLGGLYGVEGRAEKFVGVWKTDRASEQDTKKKRDCCDFRKEEERGGTETMREGHCG